MIQKCYGELFFVKRLFLGTILSQLSHTSNLTSDYLQTSNVQYDGIIDEEWDFDDKLIQNIRFTINIKDCSASESLEISKNLVTYIAKQNKQYLKNIHVKVVPN